MRNEIMIFLRDVSLKNSERRARSMVADHFGGSLTSQGRYVKINGIEYRITKNPENLKCGWDVRIMTWDHGTDFRFCKPY